VGRYTLDPHARMPPPVREDWKGLIGEYGRDAHTLSILEQDGRLHAVIGRSFACPLVEVSRLEFAFPADGPYAEEGVVFACDANGQARHVTAAGIAFERRSIGVNEMFRVQPLKPIEELEAAARRARPPERGGPFRASALVDLTSLDRTIKFDIRYATTNNFLSSVFYKVPKAFLQRPIAEALVGAQQFLKEEGFGLLIYDAYRPWYVTKMFWEATPPELRHFVSDPQKGSRHNRGATVDLTLYDIATGQSVEMVSGYDEFSRRAYPEYPGGTSLQRWHRKLLYDAMTSQGFLVYPFEWWHFDYKDWKQYPILNQSLEDLPAGNPIPSLPVAAPILD
jgi:D-alanyl-D-alanine dipeptidase